MTQSTPPSSPFSNPGHSPLNPSNGGDSSNAQILAIISLACAALSLPCTCCCWPVSLVLSVVAVVCAVLAKRESSEPLTLVALIFSIVALVIALISTILSIVMLATGQNQEFMQRLEDFLREQQGGNAAMTSYQPMEVYFYDLRTGELFSGLSTDIPPIEAPSGPAEGDDTPEAGVRAYVYSCTDCSDESSRFIGWLEMYTPQVKQKLENPSATPENFDPDAAMDEMAMYEKGHLVRTPEGERWVPSTSEEGFEIVQTVQERCGERAIPQPCMPD